MQKRAETEATSKAWAPALPSALAWPTAVALNAPGAALTGIAGGAATGILGDGAHELAKRFGYSGRNSWWHKLKTPTSLSRYQALNVGAGMLGAMLPWIYPTKRTADYLQRPASDYAPLAWNDYLGAGGSVTGATAGGLSGMGAGFAIGAPAMALKSKPGLVLGAIAGTLGTLLPQAVIDQAYSRQTVKQSSIVSPTLERFQRKFARG